MTLNEAASWQEGANHVANRDPGVSGDACGGHLYSRRIPHDRRLSQGEIGGEMRLEGEEGAPHSSAVHR